MRVRVLALLFAKMMMIVISSPLFHVVFLQIRHDFHISNVLCLFAFHIFYWPWIEYIGDVKHLLRWEDTSEDNCKK